MVQHKAEPEGSPLGGFAIQNSPPHTTLGSTQGGALLRVVQLLEWSVSTRCHHPSESTMSGSGFLSVRTEVGRSGNLA